MKNPYTQGQPEWQIFEGIKSAEALFIAFTEDVERFQAKAAGALRSAELFRAALAKLDPSFSA